MTRRISTARACEDASILLFPGLGEHKESHLGAAWSGRGLSTCLRSWRARLAATLRPTASRPRKQIPAPNESSSRKRLARRNQSPVGLRKRLHPEAHEAHWQHRSGLPRSGASSCAPPGPPTSQPTDRSRNSCVCLAMACISPCLWPRVKLCPFRTLTASIPRLWPLHAV